MEESDHTDDDDDQDLQTPSNVEANTNIDDGGGIIQDEEANLPPRPPRGTSVAAASSQQVAGPEVVHDNAGPPNVMQVASTLERTVKEDEGRPRVHQIDGSMEPLHPSDIASSFDDSATK